MSVPYYRTEYDAEGEPTRMVWCGFGPSLTEQIMSWRKQSAVIIAQVIADTKSDELHLLKDRLHAAYPWGVRANYPYRAWCEEMQQQLNPKKKATHHGGRRAEMVPEEQGKLFV